MAGASTVTAGLAGCTGGGDSGDGGDGGGGGDTTTTTTTGTATGGKYGDVTLNIWHAGITENKAARQFINNIISTMEDETGVSISITGVPYSQLLKKWRAAEAAGNLPDLVEVKTNPSFMAGGKGYDITDVFKNSKTAEMVSEGVMDFHRVWGKQATGGDDALLTWPYGVEPYLPAWRRDILEQAGVDPATVEYDNGGGKFYGRTADVYEKIQNSPWGQKDGHYPSATGMKPADAEYVAHYPPKFGGSLTGVVNKAGDAAVTDQKPYIDAVKMQVEYIKQKEYFHPNAINQGDEAITTLQWAGKIADNHVQDQGDLWQSYLDQQPQKMKDGLYRYAVPHYQERKTTMAWMDSMMFVQGNFGNQTKLEAAADFMDRFATDAVGVTQNIGAVPISPKLIQNNDWYAKTDLHKRFWRGAVQKTLDEYTFSSPPAVPNGGAITYDSSATMYQRVMTKDWDVERACKKQAEQINQVLADVGRR
ncbi:MAG: ABC transporter substrate-binding protein [Halanaeroarchaeum sp.]